MNPIRFAVFGGGCFWCTETLFLRLKGVHKVVSGYSNGNNNEKAPTYKEVCGGNTGFVEVVRVEYDGGTINYQTLVDVFMHIHDPTTLNRQGNDEGTQYRSCILFTSEEEKNIAHKIINKLKTQKYYEDAIVTAVEPLKSFFPAEDYHQNYFNLNPQQGYCSAVIKPKVDKFLKMYKHLLV